MPRDVPLHEAENGRAGQIVGTGGRNVWREVSGLGAVFDDGEVFG